MLVSNVESAMMDRRMDGKSAKTSSRTHIICITRARDSTSLDKYTNAFLGMEL